MSPQSSNGRDSRISPQGTASQPLRPFGGLARAFLRNLSPQDWLVFLYLTTLNAALIPRFSSPGFADSAIRMGGLLAFFLLVVVPVRAGRFRDGFFAPLAYRTALQGTVQTSYFFFAAFLPLVNPRCYDQNLHALDLRLFGFEPSVSLERFITPFTSEWFAFFYFCYFLVLTLHTIPIILFEQRARILNEFTLGMLLVFCIGHVGYLIVPGFGPVRALRSSFSTEFPSGLWIDTVMATVQSGGAQKDIFPSLHTAAPTFITLFSFRNRDHVPFCFSWPIVGFFTINIIVATMFLRWHWLIDVVAGILLATLGWWLSVVLTHHDLIRRRDLGLEPAWPGFRRR